MIAMKTLKTSGTIIVVAQLLLVKKEIIGKKIIRNGKKKEWEDNYKDTDGNDTNSYVNNVNSALGSSYDDDEKRIMV